ncbi:DUF2891 family protein [bacterium]|nr:MAG: DUF2891 family protein [bacterium]
MTSHMPIIAALQPVILDALARTEPHCGYSTGSGLIFTGNYDWHSSVHAHWALLSMARVGNDVLLEEAMQTRLSPENLRLEREFLFDAPNLAFELPYGRAWLALMLAELGEREERAEEIAPFHAQVEEQLLDWLETHSFDSPQFQRAAASHNSWLFALFLLQLAGSPGSRPRLEALQERVEEFKTLVENRPSDGYDFLHLPSLLALVEGAQCEFCSPSMGAVEMQNCHNAGAAVTQLWPLALSHPVQFEQELELIMARPELWRDDFHMVSHWVPQFLWMGLWLQRRAAR